MAAAIVITLTRHADTATTSNVRRSPIANATTRLRQETANSICSPSSASPAAEGLRHDEHHSEGEDRTEQRPDRGREKVVGGTLEREHLDEVATASADRTCDAELTAPLGREHDEDEEDQQDPGRDREHAEGGEEGCERGPHLVGRVDRVLLHRCHLEPEPIRQRVELGDDVVRERRACGCSAAVRYEHAANLARVPEQPLRAGERHEHRRVGRDGSVEPDDCAHGAQLGLAASRIDDDLVARPDAELLRGLRVEVDLVRAELSEREPLPAGADDRGEPVHPRGIGGEERDARLALPCARRLERDLLDDRSGHAVGELRDAERLLDLIDRALGKPAHAGGRAERARDVVDCALRRDGLVRLAESVDRSRADRVVHRVAGDERGGDDRRTEHQPDDDERRCGRADARRCARRASGGRGCGARGQRERRKRRARAIARTTRSVSTGTPKTSRMIASSTECSWGVSATTTSYASRPGSCRKTTSSASFSICSR